MSKDLPSSSLSWFFSDMSAAELSSTEMKLAGLEIGTSGLRTTELKKTTGPCRSQNRFLLRPNLFPSVLNVVEN